MSILNDGQEQIGQISWELPFALGVAVGAAIVIVLGWRALQETLRRCRKKVARGNAWKPTCPTKLSGNHE